MTGVILCTLYLLPPSLPVLSSHLGHFSIGSDSANDDGGNSVNTDVPPTAYCDDVNSSPLSPSSEQLVWCVGSLV